MNNKTFVRELTRAGCAFVKHGANHDLYANPQTGKRAAVPRHPVIKDSLCELIRKQLGLNR